MTYDMEELMLEALDGVIYCRECGNGIEPDCPACYCGWKNPIMEAGYI